MATIRELTERLSRQYEPDMHVAAPVWVEEDVLGRACEMGIPITREQAQTILDDLEDNHDCELGITWAAIDCAIEDIQSLDN